MIRFAFAPVAAALALVALPQSPVMAAEITISPTNPIIELSIYEQVEVEPDVVTIGAGVQTDAPTAVEALRQNSTEMRRVIATIKRLGIAERDIQTSSINLNAQYDYDRESQQQVFRGYRASNQVQVKLREIERAGEVLDALVSAGATNIYGPNFSIDDDTQAKSQARRRALERGLAQAKEYASFAGYADVRLLQVGEAIQGRGPVAEQGMAMRAMAADAMAAPVQPGVVSTGVSLSLTFEMVP